MSPERPAPPPDAEPALAAELARLRAENLALDQQIRLLVQTEQRLYRTQQAREQELDRIRALGAFALALVGKAEDEILARTVEVMHECFLFSAVVALVRDGDRARLAGDRGPATIDLPADARAWLAGAASAAVVDLAADPAPRALLAALGLATEGRCALVPLGQGGAVVAVSPIRQRPLVRLEPIDPSHLPVLDLIGTHVQRVIEHAGLTRDLERRSESLAEVNQRLADSLRTVERTQEQLIQAGKVEVIGRLAGGVAHDFNNLLTVILNHTAMALEELAPGTAAATELDGVMEAAQRAAEIAKQLLALGRKTVQRREYVDLGETAHDLGRVLRRLLGRRVALEVTVEDRCGVFADRAQLEQVVLNLVVNARDAMPTGGTVRLRVRSAADDDLARLEPAARDRPWIVLEVADHGVGIDEATRDRIFEPFFTTKEDGHGTGLGLSVVYGVVTQSDGVIRVDSRPGAGTRFIVLLPRATSTAKAAAQPRPAAPDRGARVLVVEDAEAIRRIAVRALERGGYQVLEAGDGLEALQVLARAADVALVVTDLNMPRLGGLELARQLEASRPDLPVLFMTGYSEELAEVSRAAPTIACLTKPFTAAQLLEHVAARLAQRPR